MWPYFTELMHAEKLQVAHAHNLADSSNIDDFLTGFANGIDGSFLIRFFCSVNGPRERVLMSKSYNEKRPLNLESDLHYLWHSGPLGLIGIKSLTLNLLAGRM